MIFYLLTTILFLFKPNFAYAASEFTIQKIINYQFNSVGDAQVTQDIKLINNYSVIYPKEYQLIIYGQQISNLTATDNLGNILKNTSVIDDSITIYLQFNQPSINTQKSTDFQIKYSVDSLAQNQGNIWKINLPKHTTDPKDQVQTTITVPTSWGKLAYSSLPLSPTVDTLNQTILVPPHLSDQSITLAFGETQIFNFNLSFFLENDLDITENFQIPLPPDTDTQTIIYTNIDPTPQNINIDSDGNFLAQYQLLPNQKINIIAKGQVQIHAPNPNFPQIEPQTFHTQTDQFWPVSNPTIITHAKTLQSPRKIYDFVVNTLVYNPNLIQDATRKDPLESLLEPQNSLCTDFTDLFISIARASSIPSREIQGFIYTQNSLLQPQNISSDILHAWPQFWNQEKNIWQQVDPTWQNTTKGDDYFNSIDLNRVILVFHGLSSLNPPPPGSYNQNLNQKTVDITPTNNLLNTQFSPLVLTLKKSKLIIHNPNQQSVTNLSITNTNFSINKTIDIIPPYSFIELNLDTVRSPLSIIPSNKDIKLDLVYDQDQVQETLLNPYSQLYTQGLIIFLVLSLFTGIILLKRK